METISIYEAWRRSKHRFGKIQKSTLPKADKNGHMVDRGGRKWVHIVDINDGDCVVVDGGKWVAVTEYDHIRTDYLDKQMPNASVYGYLENYLLECIPPMKIIELENIRAGEPSRTRMMTLCEIECRLSKLVNLPALAEWLIEWNRLTMQFVVTPQSDLFWVVLELRRWLYGVLGRSM